MVSLRCPILFLPPAQCNAYERINHRHPAVEHLQQRTSSWLVSHTQRHGNAALCEILAESRGKRGYIQSCVLVHIRNREVACECRRLPLRYFYLLRSAANRGPEGTRQTEVGPVGRQDGDVVYRPRCGRRDYGDSRVTKRDGTCVR